jgi:hypothetical protein
MEGGCYVGQAERGDGDEQGTTLLAIGACRLECGNAAHESIVDMLAATHLQCCTALAVSGQLGKLKEKSQETWTKFGLYDTTDNLKRHAPSTELPPLRIRPGPGLVTGPRFCHCFLPCSGQTHNGCFAASLSHRTFSLFQYDSLEHKALYIDCSKTHTMHCSPGKSSLRTSTKRHDLHWPN